MARVADRTGVRRDKIETEMQKTRPASVPRLPHPMPRQSPTLNPRIRKHGAELQLLKVMVRGVEWVERAAELIADEDFYDPLYRAIFRALLDDPELRRRIGRRARETAEAHFGLARMNRSLEQLVACVTAGQGGQR